MSDEIKTYVTKDGKVFKTTLDIGEVDPKLYTLEHLEVAEKRVHRGTNRNLKGALGSTRALMQKNRTRPSAFKGSKFDEYGLDKSIYSEEQIEYVHEKIKEYEEDYESSTPFEKDTIANMAKTSLKLNQLEAKMMQSDDKKIVDQYTSLRREFSNMAGDLKHRPKDQKNEDLSKSRTSLSQIVFNYENRIRSGKMERDEVTQKMRERMAKIRAEHIDGRFEQHDGQ